MRSTRLQSRAQTGARGMTLVELLIALFIFLVGIVGLLAAMPTGINSATKVIFQDAAIHLSRSKFAEFRRDRIDPRTELLDAASYMNGPRQEPKNGLPGGWRDFAHSAGSTYENFDDIERYQWRIEQTLDMIGTDAANNNSPKTGGGTDVGLTRVTVTINLKGTNKEYRFTQYMCAYGK